jgi:putative polymerase
VLGKAQRDIKSADTVIHVVTVIVLLFALFEYFFLEAYLEIFDVIKYYVARGSLDALDPSLQFANGLMLNGIRPPELGGRALLPSLLDDHRVSSLFLESISLGNFGCLVAFWGMARSRMERRWRFWLIAAGIALIILSDSRFNASFLAVGILILLISPRITTPVVLLLPFVVIATLYLAATNASAQDLLLTGLSLKDRLLYSGGILLHFDLSNWLGIEAPDTQTLDSGYAYVISNVGLFGLAAFWFWLMSLSGHNRYFYAFRNTMAAYFAALFCISASQFTIKTAALLWFLMGALSVAGSKNGIVRSEL